MYTYIQALSVHAVVIVVLLMQKPCLLCCVVFGYKPLICLASDAVHASHMLG